MSDAFGANLVISARGHLRCGLPPAPVGPADSGEWYHDAEKLPQTRVVGWFGATIGSSEDDDDIQLFWYESNHLEPVLRMALHRLDLLKVYEALGRFIKERM